jgi:hypothetical protein
MRTKIPISEYIGKKFSRLTILSEASPLPCLDGHPKRRVLCKCDCGNEITARLRSIQSGLTQSCGCLQKEIVSAPKESPMHLTHGKSKTGTYNTWIAMRSRCLNPNNTGFENYGGRGIKICERWLNSFENFIEDMGERPKGASIEREDTNGNYEPSNCKWATRKEQQRNQRTTKLTNEDVNKIKQVYELGNTTIKQIAQEYGVTKTTITNAIKGRTWA